MATLRWVRAEHGQVPLDAVHGGHVGSGEVLFVGRANHLGNLLPGKVHPSHKCCYIAYGGKEHKHSNYEVLINPSNQERLKWVPAQEGSVPTGAIAAGSTGGRDGETIFVGRTTHSGDCLPGKVHPSHHCVYVSWGGSEHAHRQYDVLVCKHVSPPRM